MKRILESELALLRWLILHRWISGKAAIPTILRIRQAIERIEHEQANG